MANDKPEFHIIDDEGPEPLKPKRKRKPKPASTNRTVITLTAIAIAITFSMGILVSILFWETSSSISPTPLSFVTFAPAGTLQPPNPDSDIIAPSVYDVAVSPDGRNFVVAYSEGEAHSAVQLRRFRRVASLESDVIELHTTSAPVSELAFNADSTLVAAGFASPNISEVIIWDVATGQQVMVLDGHLMAFHPTRPEIATVNYAGHIMIWDTSTFTQLATFDVSAANVFNMTYSPDGTMLALGFYSSAITAPQITVLSRTSGQPLMSVPPIGDGLIDMAFSPDSSELAITTGDYIQTFGMVDGSSHLLELATDTARGVAYRPNDQALIAVGGAAYWGGDPRIGYWQLDGEQPILLNRVQGHDRDIFEVVFMPDGQYFITVSADGSVRMWDANTLEEVSRLQI